MAPKRPPRARSASRRVPAWDWSFAEDGALALDRYELWEETAYPRALDVSQSRALPTRLNRRPRSSTVPPMRSRRPVRRATLAHRERRARRVRRAAVLLMVAAVVVVTLTLTAFGSAPARLETAAAPPPPAKLVTAGPPKPQVIAVRGALRLQLPVAQESLSAIGYHAAPNGALALQPLGRRGNNGLLRRLVERVLGSGGSGLTWYQLDGADGPPTSAIDVGAPAGSDVYAPVDGTVIAIDDYVLSGTRYGSRIDIQSSSAPSLVVSVTRLAAARRLTVGGAVSAAHTRLGHVLDLSGIERQALARYTQDDGNHVTLEVGPAAPLTLG